MMKRMTRYLSALMLLLPQKRRCLEVQKFIRSPEVQKSSHYNKLRFELEVQKEEVPKSGHYNKQRRSVGIPADEATSVVAGLVPATSHLYGIHSR